MYSLYHLRPMWRAVYCWRSSFCVGEGDELTRHGRRSMRNPLCLSPGMLLTACHWFRSRHKSTKRIIKEIRPSKADLVTNSEERPATTKRRGSNMIRTHWRAGHSCKWLRRLRGWLLLHNDKPTPRYARCRLALVYYRRYAAPLACWRTLRRARVSTRVNPTALPTNWAIL